MRKVIGGLVALVILLAAGFFYRYEIEKPKIPVVPSGGTNPGVACTDEAKVCPDGSAVGRTGPSCSFAICPPPNAELTAASTTLDFVLPSGYVRHIVSSDNSAYIASYIQSTGSTSASTIDVYDYAIPVGETAAQVMLVHTIFDPSGLQATSTSQFKAVTEGKNTFYEILISRFEGQVQSSYYLYEPNSVLRFDVIERGVQNWTSTSLNPNTLPQHSALQQMLSMLQISE
jgi:hypothetical protein